MNKKIFLALFVGIFALMVNPVLADHDYPIGTCGCLKMESEELGELVAYSTLAHHVKSSVFQFVGEVRRLMACVESGPTNDHLGGGVPPFCRNLLDRVHKAFYPVQRYLFDTDWDYPEIFGQYLKVRRALRSLNVH